MGDTGASRGRWETGQVFEAAIRLAIVALLLFWALRILSPFIHVVVWSAIIAVAVYPAFRWLVRILGGRAKLAATVFTLVCIGGLVVPAVELAVGSISGVRTLAREWEAGTIEIPAPSDRVKDWPLIGERVHAIWLSASENLEGALERFQEPLKRMGGTALHALAGAGTTILMFTFSLVIAGVLMLHGDACRRETLLLSRRLAGEAGEGFVELATKTVRSVAQGILGIAFIQALLAAIGLTVMDVPLAGVWAFGVLILAIVQLPPLVILGPIAAWTFSAHDATAATIFTVYCIAVGVSDSFLKPLLLGRGVDVPMLVILLGAIGGMITSGILGLFTGAVVLALMYRLFVAWLRDDTGGKKVAPMPGTAAKPV